MNLIPLSFILPGLLALHAAAAAASPAPALVRLDQALIVTLRQKAQGQLAPERIAEFAAKFRTDLAKAEADAAPTAENKELDSRIIARLRELNVGTAGPAPLFGGKDSRSDLSRAHFEQKTTPAVVNAEKRILSSEPFSGNPRGPGDVLASAGKTRKIRFAPVDPDRLPIVLPVKVSPSAAPPELSGGQAPRPASPLPLVPLAVAAGLGAAGYGVSQSKSSYVSSEGLDSDHPAPQGPYQRLVANALLGGAAAIVLVVAGSAAITAATPVLMRYAPPVIEQGVRLAGSEAGSLNPNAATEIAPEIEESAVEAEQVVLEPGERGLHLFKYKDATSTIASRWARGDHFLYLPNQGSPAANWAQNSRVLRIAMRAGKPIYDSYVDAITGKQIPTTGFLNAERNLLGYYGWRFNPLTGAYHPPLQ